MLRYNIALLPDDGAPFIAFAQEFSKDADYSLGAGVPGKSLPHVTLAQFEVLEGYNLDSLWQDALRKWEQKTSKLQVTSLMLYFSQTGFEDEISASTRHVWLQLLPDERLLETLNGLHEEIAALLEKRNLYCLNQAHADYAPHLTLALTADRSLIERLKSKTPNLEGNFSLALGKSDAIGQFTEVVQGAFDETEIKVR